MSFILDALRKSEHERQRNKSPGIADVRTTSRRTGRNFWLPLVALLVGINLSLLALLWYLGADGPATQTPAQPARPMMAQPSAPIVAPAPAAPATSAAQAMPQAPRSGRDLSAELSDERPIDTDTSALRSGAAGAPQQTGTRQTLPTLTELQLAGSINVRPLHLDIHVYSQTASERFVFINNSRYREGDRLAEGPDINAISPEGVELSYQGRNFLLLRE